MAPPQNTCDSSSQSTVTAEPASTSTAGWLAGRRRFAATASSRRSMPTRLGATTRVVSGNCERLRDWLLAQGHAVILLERTHVSEPLPPAPLPEAERGENPSG